MKNTSADRLKEIIVYLLKKGIYDNKRINIPFVFHNLTPRNYLGANCNLYKSNLLQEEIRKSERYKQCREFHLERASSLFLPILPSHRQSLFIHTINSTSLSPSTSDIKCKSFPPQNGQGKALLITSVLCDVALESFFEVSFLVSIFVCILNFSYNLCHTDTKPFAVICYFKSNIGLSVI